MNPSSAEPGLRSLRDLLGDVGDDCNLANVTFDLGELLLHLGHGAEVLELTAQVRHVIAPDELAPQIRWRTLRSVVMARLGRIEGAMPLMLEAEGLVRNTELMALLSDTMLAKAKVLTLADLEGDAVSAAREALALYEVKQFAAHIGWARDMLESLTV